MSGKQVQPAKDKTTKGRIRRSGDPKRLASPLRLSPSLIRKKVSIRRPIKPRPRRSGIGLPKGSPTGEEEEEEEPLGPDFSEHVENDSQGLTSMVADLDVAEQTEQDGQIQLGLITNPRLVPSSPSSPSSTASSSQEMDFRSAADDAFNKDSFFSNLSQSHQLQVESLDSSYIRVNENQVLVLLSPDCRIYFLGCCSLRVLMGNVQVLDCLLSGKENVDYPLFSYPFIDYAVEISCPSWGNGRPKDPEWNEQHVKQHLSPSFSNTELKAVVESMVSTGWITHEVPKSKYSKSSSSITQPSGPRLGRHCALVLISNLPVPEHLVNQVDLPKQVPGCNLLPGVYVDYWSPRLSKDFTQREELVVSNKRSVLFCTRPFQSWTNFRDLSSDISNSKSSYAFHDHVWIVTGNKSSGKSTLLRSLVSQAMEETAAADDGFEILWLDADPGQTEMMVPGFVSLHQVSTSMLNPAWCSFNQHNPICRMVVGQLSSQHFPVVYQKAIEKLVRLCEHRHEQAKGKCLVFVNTAGWVRGYGAQMLSHLIAQFNMGARILNLDNGSQVAALLQEVPRKSLVDRFRLVQIGSSIQAGNVSKRRRSPKHLRDMLIGAYMTSSRTFEILREDIFKVFQFDAEPTSHWLSHWCALTGHLVAVLKLDTQPRNEAVIKVDSLDSWNCIGVGMIKAISLESGTMLIECPEDLASWTAEHSLDNVHKVKFALAYSSLVQPSHHLNLLAAPYHRRHDWIDAYSGDEPFCAVSSYDLLASGLGVEIASKSNHRSRTSQV